MPKKKATQVPVKRKTPQMLETDAGDSLRIGDYNQCAQPQNDQVRMALLWSLEADAASLPLAGVG